MVRVKIEREPGPDEMLMVQRFEVLAEDEKGGM